MQKHCFCFDDCHKFGDEGILWTCRVVDWFCLLVGDSRDSGNDDDANAAIGRVI